MNAVALSIVEHKPGNNLMEQLAQKPIAIGQIFNIIKLSVPAQQEQQEHVKD